MSDVLDKIRKLMALAGNNSNESEAARAMEMASSLMMKHGIEEAQLNVGKKVSHEIGETEIFKDQLAFHRILAGAVALLMGCTTYNYRGIDGVSFVGREDNRNAARELYVYAILQVEQLYKTALPKGLSQGERSKWRKTFKLACSIRVNSRVHEILATQSIPGAGTGSTALVVCHRDTLTAEIDAYGATRGVKVKKPKPVSYSHVGAAFAGHFAGNQVELNKGVGQ